MSRDNELREMIEVHLGQAGVLGRIDPTLEKNLINDLISDITLAINQTKAEAVAIARAELIKEFTDVNKEMPEILTSENYLYWKGVLETQTTALDTLDQLQESE